MITISQAVERAVAETPLFGRVLQHGIVNYSALARKIRPSVEAIVLEPVTDGAVTIALKRYAHARRAHQTEHPPTVRTVHIRSGLTVLVYANSPQLESSGQKLFSRKMSSDSFIQFSQGSSESSFVVSDDALAILKKLMAAQKPVAEYRHLSAISVRMPAAVMEKPGIFAPLLDALAWQNISVLQIGSHFTEITFVVADRDADRAFAIIKSSAKSAPDTSKKGS